MLMALFGRGRNQLYIGRAPSRLNFSTWRRRLRSLLIVVAVVSLFILGLRYEHRVANQRIAQVDIEQIEDAARNFRQDFGRCPHDVEELAHPPAGRGAYLTSSPVDPWGNPYFLQCPSRWAEDEVDVATRGPDGQWLGGDDMSTDL